MEWIELIKSFVYGIIEGITEWLPISSTGHLMLLRSIWPLKCSDAFWEMFKVVIQLGAVLAVTLLYFREINPWDKEKDREARLDTWKLWIKIVIGCIPVGLVGLLVDDFLDEHLERWYVVAGSLILFGLAFILVENRNRGRKPLVKSVKKMTPGMALVIGFFQMLALIPGTSRSGVSILGAVYMGVSRGAATEFSFLMAIPTVFAASGLKIVKSIIRAEAIFSVSEIITLFAAVAVTFIVSLFAARALINFLKTHSLKLFGYYRIVLGLIMIVYYAALSKA